MEDIVLEEKREVVLVLRNFAGFSQTWTQDAGDGLLRESRQWECVEYSYQHSPDAERRFLLDGRCDG